MARSHKTGQTSWSENGSELKIKLGQRPFELQSNCEVSGEQNVNRRERKASGEESTKWVAASSVATTSSPLCVSPLCTLHCVCVHCALCTVHFVCLHCPPLFQSTNCSCLPPSSSTNGHPRSPIQLFVKQIHPSVLTLSDC